MAYDSSADCFLKLGDIDGECRRKGLENWIEISGFNFNATQTAAGGYGGGQSGAARVSFGDLTYQHRMDKASPKLMQAMFQGKVFDEAQIVARRAGLKDGTPVRYLVWELKEVLVSGHGFGGGSDGEFPMENCSLRFAIEKMHYREVVDGQPQGPISSGWNSKTNKEA
ncbi:MAG: type VI secretion system tube protein Hcp [Bryobacteraceae bacterium]|nr:type VI secretion system tube protein Hcp [Bryobacteraceae bacterium]